MILFITRNMQRWTNDFYVFTGDTRIDFGGGKAAKSPPFFIFHLAFNTTATTTVDQTGTSRRTLFKFWIFDLVGELDVKTDHLGFMHDERKTARLTVAMLMIDGGRTNLDVIFGTREQATAHFDQTETQMIMTYPPHFPIRLRLQTLPCFGLNFSLLPAFI